MTGGEAAGCAVVAVPSVAGVSFALRAPRRLVAASLAAVAWADLAQLPG